MFSRSRTIILLAACVVVAALALPAIGVAQAPGEEQYRLELPEPGSEGSGSGESQGSGGGTEAGTVSNAAADSADEGGLPILLVILAGTALAGASIAIIRRQRHED